MFYSFRKQWTSLTEMFFRLSISCVSYRKYVECANWPVWVKRYVKTDPRIVSKFDLHTWVGSVYIIDCVCAWMGWFCNISWSLLVELIIGRLHHHFVTLNKTIFTARKYEFHIWIRYIVANDPWQRNHSKHVHDPLKFHVPCVDAFCSCLYASMEFLSRFQLHPS